MSRRKYNLHLFLTLAITQLMLCSVEGTNLLSQAHISSHSVQHLSARHEVESSGRNTHESCLLENFHYPHHCKVPDCSFMVAWREDDEESVLFNLTAKVDDSSMVWAAIGFSDDRKMVNTDAVLCYLKKDGESEIHVGLILADQPRRVKILQDMEQHAIKPYSVQVRGNKIHCSFSRKKVVTKHLEEMKSLNQQRHILVASGRLYNPSEDKNKTLMSKHFKKAASNCKCNVTACAEKCDCPDGFKYQLLKLHSVLMCVAFIFFIPTGAIISRYYKMVFLTSWFKGHLAMMLIGALWALVGLGMIIGHTGVTFTVGIHQMFGITCLFLVVVQPLIAFLRPRAQPFTVRRAVFVSFHKTVAISILTTSSVALFMGTYIFCNVLMTWIMSILGLSVLTNLGFILLLEVLTRTHKFSTIPPVGYHKVTKNDDLSESEEEVFVRDDPNKKTGNGRGGARKNSHAFKIEKTLLVIYIIQAFIFSVLVASLLYYFDSHKHGD